VQALLRQLDFHGSELAAADKELAAEALADRSSATASSVAVITAPLPPGHHARRGRGRKHRSIHRPRQGNQIFKAMCPPYEGKPRFRTGSRDGMDCVPDATDTGCG